eukprot:63863-Rhodomonas_salina.4
MPGTETADGQQEADIVNGLKVASPYRPPRPLLSSYAAAMPCPVLTTCMLPSGWVQRLHLQALRLTGAQCPHRRPVQGAALHLHNQALRSTEEQQNRLKKQLRKPTLSCHAAQTHCAVPAFLSLFCACAGAVAMESGDPTPPQRPRARAASPERD